MVHAPLQTTQTEHADCKSSFNNTIATELLSETKPSIKINPKNMKYIGTNMAQIIVPHSFSVKSSRNNHQVFPSIKDLCFLYSCSSYKKLIYEV